MLDTLKCIFEGRRDLFKGLKIEKKKYDWKTYPVVMLNMAEVVAPTVETLRENLLSMVKGLIKSFRLDDVEIVSEPGMTLGNFFKALMYQSGYLTIKKVIGAANGVDVQKLILGVPNQEVRTAIRSGWFDSFVKIPSSEFDALVDVAKGQVAAEEGSARGYADAIIETKSFVWVFEFKFNKSANAAVRQIREKGYAAQYNGDKRPVTLVGINFRSAKRNIDEPLFAPLQSCRGILELRA